MIRREKLPVSPSSCESSLRMPFLRSRPELLLAFRDGDRDALSQVYWAYIERVESFVRHAMRSGGGDGRSDVVDVLQ